MSQANQDRLGNSSPDLRALDSSLRQQRLRLNSDTCLPRNMLVHVRSSQFSLNGERSIGVLFEGEGAGGVIFDESRKSPDHIFPCHSCTSRKVSSRDKP